MTHNKDIESQNKRIAKHLKKGKSISALRALELFSCLRLASRINQLRNPPYNMNIESKMIYEHPVKFARYKIIKNKKG